MFSKNIGKHLSIDETDLSHGELYTVLPNKSSKGKSVTIVAIVSGTSFAKVLKVLQKLPLRSQSKVEEIGLDMAGSMIIIAKHCFPNAVLETDRFHVQKLANEAVQELRIKHRWEAIDAENEAIEKNRKQKKGLSSSGT